MPQKMLQTLLKVLLAQYFNSSKCILFITDESNLRIIPNTPIYFVNIVLVNGVLDRKYVLRNHGCRDVIIAANDSTFAFTQFEDIIRNKENVVEKYNDKKYVVFVGDNSTADDNIFEYQDLEYVSNLLVVEAEQLKIRQHKHNRPQIPIEYEDVSYIFYTNKFVGTYNLNEKIFLDKWFSQNSSFLLGANLFPDKLVNLHGRHLKLASFMYEPYAVYDQSKKIYDGIETALCNEYALIHNATPEYVDVGTGYWGIVYENWTGEGVLGYLAEDKADMGFAAVYRWVENYPFLDFSWPHIRGGVRLYVPAPRLAGGWFLPTYSFSVELWAVSVFTFFFSSIFLWLISIVTDSYIQREQTEKNFVMFLSKYISILFTTIRVFLEQPLLGMYKTGVYKFFMLFIIIQTLLLSFFYNSGFASIMTIPRYVGAIKTIQDFADSDLKWGAPSDAWLKSLENADEEKYKTIVSKYVVATDEDLIEFGRMQIFGYPLERLQFGHYAILEYHTKDMVPHYRITTEDLNWDYCIYMLRKHSIYLTTLNQLIMRVYESGIMAFWENEVVAKYMDVNMQNLINYHYFHKEGDPGVVILSWKHVQGAFGLLIVGLVLSTICFALEVLNYHHQTRATKLLQRESLDEESKVSFEDVEI